MSGRCHYCAALQTERLFSLVFLPEGQITGIIMDVANVTKELFRLGLSLKPKKQFPTSYNKRDLFWLCSNSFCTVMTKILKVSKFQKQIFLFSFPPKNKHNYFLMSTLTWSNQKNEGNLSFIMLITGYLI